MNDETAIIQIEPAWSKIAVRSPQANRVIGELRDERLFRKREVDNQDLKPTESQLLPGCD